MNKKVWKIGLIVFLFLVFCSVVVAAPPAQVFEPTTAVGLEIRYPIIETIQQNKEFAFHFHTVNATNGIPILNTTPISCYFHLYNNSGSHIYRKENFNDIHDTLDFEVKVGGNNFSKLGEYSYVFQCNTTSFGGFVAAPFEVTQDGHPAVDKGQVGLPLILSFIALIFLFTFLVFRVQYIPLKVFFFLILLFLFVSTFWFLFCLFTGATAADIGGNIEIFYKITLIIFSSTFALTVPVWLIFWLAGWSWKSKDQKDDEEFERWH